MVCEGGLLSGFPPLRHAGLPTRNIGSSDFRVGHLGRLERPCRREAPNRTLVKAIDAPESERWCGFQAWEASWRLQATSSAAVFDPLESLKDPKKKKGKKEADYFSAHDPVATAKNKAEKAAKKSAAKS